MSDDRVAPDGRRLRWQRHNEARREAVIEAAIKVLEAQAPGEEFQIQPVADEAGLARTVIYRYFDDRADLDRSVQRRICELLGAKLFPALHYDGTPEEILRRVVDAFVRWSVDHPTLLWYVERDLSGWGPSPLTEAFEQLALAIERLVNAVVGYSGVQLGEDDRSALDPWVFGLVGATFTAIRRWCSRPERKPDVDAFIEIIAESIWFQLDGMAAARGVSMPAGKVSDLIHDLGNVGT
ncbi:TetR/AcrR family transcriptional regulator [Nocardioides panacisoli]|uniref:TetR/AcrR family transcriptional regulator n=1 Tax=Nocardioides panacisoli TaxID=627624 RepID=A0ABP7I4S0_9ACTN